MKSNVVVSVIMPAYNAERYIKESIQSVMGQSYSHWELIIVNDGSTDDTLKIIECFQDDRIIALSQPNQGVSYARNRALEMASGKYITFLDADDTLTKESLKIRVEHFQQHPEVDIVDGKVAVKDDSLKNDIRMYQPCYHGKLLPKLLALDDKVFFNICYMFKHNFLDSVRFKEKMTHGEDLLFYIELSSKNDLNYGYVDEIIYNYRSGHGSAMADLEGLENGYIRLLQEIKKLQCTSLAQWMYLKVKITKIMFLSWLRNKSLWNAFKSTYKVCFKGII